MTGNAGQQASAQPPSPEVAAAAMSALRRILASEAFRGSGRSRDFLSYVVTETLAGRGGRLSERIVGRYALDRGGEFDGRFDASVRVQATRVRRSLDDYYTAEGRDDAIRIALPAGRYRPTFTPQQRPPASMPLEPGLVIVSFEALGGTDATIVAAALTDSLTHRLATFPALRVIGPVGSSSDDPRRIGVDSGARFILQGRAVLEGAALRLSARLTDGDTGQVVWSVSQTADPARFNGTDLEDAWVGSVAGELGDLTGVVARQSKEAPPGHVSAQDFEARAAFHRFLETGDGPTVLAAEKALRQSLATGPRPWLTVIYHASALANRAFRHLSEDRDGDLAEAEALARESLASQPDNSLALCVLATVALGRHQWEVARLHATQAAARAPWHPTTVISAGSILALAGDLPGGAALLREALKLHPSHPGYMHDHLAVERLVAGDPAGALAEASVMQSPEIVWGPLYRAMALAAMGHLVQAWRDLDQALLLEPGLLDDPAELFTRNTLLDEHQVATLVAYLEPFREARPTAKRLS